MNTFKPTENQIRLAEAVFVAMTHEQTVRPIVIEYENAILAKHRFPLAREWLEYGREPRIVLSREEAFLMSDEDAKTYFAECFAARDAANLNVSRPENCPLLEAENLRIMAEHALIKEMGKLPGWEAFGKGSLTLKFREKAVDLMLKLLAPYCGNSREILDGYAA